MQLFHSGVHDTIFHSHPPLHHGVVLKMLRDRHRLPQSAVVVHLPATMSQRRYSSFELGQRVPHPDELPAIYLALSLAGVRFTLQDRRLYLDSARHMYEAKKTHKVRLTDTDWDRLRLELAHIDHLPLDPVSARPQSVLPKRITETRHLVGRQEWIETLYATLEGPLPAKILIVQGPQGSGKTSEMHRIATHFLRRIPRWTVALCEPPPLDLEMVGSELTLEWLLGEILESVRASHSVAMPTTGLDDRIAYVLHLLSQTDHPVVALLDNAEQILDEEGKLPLVWTQFLTHFLQTQLATTLVLATKEWPGWFRETQFVKHVTIPPLTREEGTLLLERLGLEGIPEEQLGRVVHAVGGIPQCLEWVATLAGESFLHDDWAAFEDEGDRCSPAHHRVQRLARLLDDPSLFGGPIAQRLEPLLERIMKRLSPEAATALQDVAVSPIPLASGALKALYRDPKPLNELRNASLLVAYPRRVQLLPMVAAQVRKRMTSDQVCAAEERLILALTQWLNGSHVDVHEQGVVVTELACLLLSRHQLLAAAELVLYYGWLSSHVGHMLRLAHRVQQVLGERPWDGTTENEREAEYGGLLLHEYLASYLGEDIDDHARAESYERLLANVSAGQVTISPLMHVYLLDHILRDYATTERFEDAQRLFQASFLHLEPFLANDQELHSTLLSKHAALSTRWSEYASSHGQLEEAGRMQKQAITLYQSCLALVEYALQETEEGTLRKSTLRKKQATFLNNLAYQLNRRGQYEEALTIVNACIDLKEQGYAERDSLAASYGEKSQILAALGQFQEALRLDGRAREEIQRCAEAGDTLAQEEQWIYQVNQGRLLVLLGKIDEATRLLREAEPRIQPRRRIFQIMAQDTLREIQQGLAKSPSGQFQLDWRWVERYRALSAYDAYWWWAYTGPFTQEEQRRWDHFFVSPVDEETKGQLRKLLVEAREREVDAALAEYREPDLHYPAIEIDPLRQRITDFLTLDAEISAHEPNAIVRRLYHGAIEDEVCFLRLIEATYEGKSEQFWELTQHLYPPPTHEEERYAINRLTQVLLQGLHREDTRQVSQHIIHILQTEAHLVLDMSPEMKVTQGVRKGISCASSQRDSMLSAHAAKRFFEALLHESGYDGWRVILDQNVSGPRVESGLRQIFLPDRSLSLADMREYVSHELLGHVTRSITGERSLLGLLGMGTKAYMPTEEGLADYHERHIATLHGDAFDDSGTWLGPLSVVLACGIEGASPLTFSALYAFLEPFLLVYRLLWRDDEDMPTAKQKARNTARILCLRTYRGVPNLHKAGICLTKDVVYLRGHLLIEQAVAKDEAVLDHLSVGKVALDVLPDLQELGIIASQHVSNVRKRVYDPDLDAFILSFERDDAVTE